MKNILNNQVIKINECYYDVQNIYDYLKKSQNSIGDEKFISSRDEEVDYLYGQIIDEIKKGEFKFKFMENKYFFLLL